MNTEDKALIENPSLDRWVWILKRTVMDNNWSSLHEGLRTDNSYFRELADTLDYVNDEVNSVHPMHQVRQSINSSIGLFKVFREIFAVDMFKKHTATTYDSNLVISMFNRTVTFEENDKELLNAIKDSFNKRKSDGYPLVNNLDQAFQLSRVEGRPTNPYKVPENIRQVVAMMIDEDMSGNACITKLDEMANNHSLKTKDNKGLWRTANSQPRPQIWGANRWQDEMDKYKWAALNDYLYDRMEKGRTTLDNRELKRIKSNWNKIIMPNELTCYPTFLKLGIFGLVGKDGKKIVTTEVNKANNNLH
jgi:hypothetical protein